MLTPRLRVPPPQHSLLFDQPAAHHNPQRDPYPSTTLVSLDARFGDVAVAPVVLSNAHSSIRAPARKVDWTQHAVRELRWYDGAWSWLETNVLPVWVADAFADRQRYEFVRNLAGLHESEAGRSHSFTYVGGGYIFSPYVPKAHEVLFKMFVEHLEGSLFDWQIGDLFPSCTAGIDSQKQKRGFLNIGASFLLNTKSQHQIPSTPNPNTRPSIQARVPEYSKVRVCIATRHPCMLQATPDFRVT